MIDVQAVVDAVNTYTASVKIGLPHCERIKKLCTRIVVLSELHNELYQWLLAEFEIVKDILNTTEVSTPPALAEFQVRYAEFNTVTKLANEAMAEINSEKDFVDWHQATAVLPQSTTALKLLETLAQQERPEAAP